MSTTCTFNIRPVAKPRMTRADTWKKRPPVVKYWQFKDNINRIANSNKFKLGNVVEATFYVAMPKSWSKKKQQEMCGKPHQQRPDLDNFIKSFDAFTDEDKTIWKITASKYWHSDDMIVISNLDED